MNFKSNKHCALLYIKKHVLLIQKWLFIVHRFLSDAFLFVLLSLCHGDWNFWIPARLYFGVSDPSHHHCHAVYEICRHHRSAADINKE